MSEIVFLVDSFDQSGMFQTIMDRVKDISENWFDNLFDLRKTLYKKLLGKYISLQTYNSVTNFDPNKRYFYLIPLNNWDNDIQKFVFLLSKEKQKRLADNNVGILIAHDLEASPIFGLSGLRDSLDWFNNQKYLYGNRNLKYYFLFASDLVDAEKKAMKERYNNTITFLYSPLMIPYFLERLEKLVDFKTVYDLYFSTPKEKQFLALIRHPRFHRSSILHGLRVNNLLTEGFYSNNLPWTWDTTTIINPNEYSQKVKADMANPIEKVMLDIVDRQDLRNNTHLGNIIPVDYMSRSSYDLVQETATSYEVFNPSDMAILSEKTLKSLYYGRPFIVNGGPNLLKLTKDLGFKTCDFLFDESYDREHDLMNRQELMVNNVKHYANNKTELEQKILSNKSVLEFNHNRMVNFNFELELTKTLRNVI